MKWMVTTEAKKWQEQQLTEGITGGADTLKLTGEEGQQIKGFGGCFNELGHIALSKISKEKQE